MESSVTMKNTRFALKGIPAIQFPKDRVPRKSDPVHQTHCEGFLVCLNCVGILKFRKKRFLFTLIDFSDFCQESRHPKSKVFLISQIFYYSSHKYVCVLSPRLKVEN